MAPNDYSDELESEEEDEVEEEVEEPVKKKRSAKKWKVCIGFREPFWRRRSIRMDQPPLTLVMQMLSLGPQQTEACHERILLVLSR
jgi:hypothetical protein